MLSLKPTLKTIRRNQSGFATHLVLPIVVVAAIAAVGTYVLAKSHAQTPNNSTSVSTQTTPAGTTSAILTAANAMPGIYTDKSSVPYSFIGYQTVNYVSPGQSLTYNQGVKGNVTACFYVYVTPPKSGTVTAKVEFANNNNSVIRYLSSTATNDLRRICVVPGTTTNPGFSVKNLTSIKETTSIEVYQDILTW